MRNELNIINSNTLLIFIILVFIINPFISIIFNIFYLLYSNYSNRFIILLIFIISLYFGLINTTKIPESDLLNYKIYFHNASHLSFSDYAKYYERLLTREPVFYILTYVMNILYKDNYYLYIITTTFIIYYISLISIYKYWLVYDRRISIIIFSLLIFSLFYIIFSASSHLIRQLLASSIFLYYLMNKCVKKKNKFILPIIAVMIHNSSIVLFLLALIPGIEKRFNLNRILYSTVIFLSAVFVVQVMLQIFGEYIYNFPIVGIAFTRFFLNEPLSDTREFVQSYSLIARYVLPITMALIGILLYKYKNNNINYSFINIQLMYFIIIETLFYMGYEFFAVRLNYYMYLFIPILIPHFFSLFKKKESSKILQPIQIMILIVLFSTWLWFLSYSKWTFAPLYELLLLPLLFYFL